MLLHNAFPILFGMPGGSEWIIILILVVILFGARKIPDLARGLGRGITEFKRGLREIPDNDVSMNSSKNDDSGSTEEKKETGKEDS